LGSQLTLIVLRRGGASLSWLSFDLGAAVPLVQTFIPLQYLLTRIWLLGLFSFFKEVLLGLG